MSTNTSPTCPWREIHVNISYFGSSNYTLLKGCSWTRIRHTWRTYNVTFSLQTFTFIVFPVPMQWKLLTTKTLDSILTQWKLLTTNTLDSILTQWTLHRTGYWFVSVSKCDYKNPVQFCCTVCESDDEKSDASNTISFLYVLQEWFPTTLPTRLGEASARVPLLASRWAWLRSSSS